MIFDKIINNILNESGDKITGGLADNLTPEDLAKKHKVEVAVIIDQIKKGIEVEKEHTESEEVAKEIAMDHLFEYPDYYDALAQMERDLEASDRIQAEMTAAGGEVFGNNPSIGHEGGNVGNDDFYARGDARIPKGGGTAQSIKDSKKKKKKKKKKSNDIEPMFTVRRRPKIKL